MRTLVARRLAGLFASLRGRKLPSIVIYVACYALVQGLAILADSDAARTARLYTEWSPAARFAAGVAFVALSLNALRPPRRHGQEGGALLLVTMFCGLRVYDYLTPPNPLGVISWGLIGTVGLVALSRRWEVGDA